MAPPDLRQLALAVAFEHAPGLMVAVDSGHRVVLANPAFVKIFGSREGEPCYAVYRGRGEICEDCPTRKAFGDGQRHLSERHTVFHQGKTGTWWLQAEPIRGADGSIDHVLQLAVDLTREEELAQALRETERLAAVGLTTAGLAHTVKSMLGGLEGGVYLVDSSLEKGSVEEVRVGWEMVRRYIEQINGLVHNLLRYARPHQRQLEQVDPNQLVEEVVELFASKAAMIDIELLGDTQAGIGALLLEKEVIRGCLANLVSNALDACVWDPAEDKEHRIQVTARARSGGGVIFEVIDNGMGIPVENQQKTLTSRFTTKGIRGTGLGLLLTKKAVQEHAGAISFTSTHGEGTTFRIELPDATPAPD